MNKWYFYGFILISFSLFSACGKTLPPDWRRLEGTWANEEVFMEITGDGSIKYKRQSADESVSINGWIVEFSDKGFAVSILFTRIDFEVNRKPFYNEEMKNMQMVVDGRLLTKRKVW